MTERLRAQSAYPAGDPRRTSVSGGEGLSTKKTMLVLVVVVGCFAVLWPKLFYPMLVNNANTQMKPGPVDKTTGCCDVISDLDLHTIQIMSELCSTIIDTTGPTPPSPKEIVIQCRKAVLETCGIDISAALQDRIVSLGHSVKQILEEVRSLNGSLCLKYNFGLSSWRLGVPHRVNIHLDSLNSIRQERPTHLRSEMIHPAFKERGRAIPQPEVSGLPRRSSPPPRIVEGRPGPIPGMRPAMGGPGHMVAPSKQSNYGFMGVLMPIYTIGFVVFFTYTVMKLVFKKKAEAHVGAPLYPPCEPDERFHKEVFEASKDYFHRPSRDSSKIVVNAVSALLEEVNLELEARKVKTPETVYEQDEIKANGSLPKEEEQGTVKVMAMETTTSAESGKKWSRPESPVLPHPHPVVPKEPTPPPQRIFLEGSLPPQSQILVAESATETQKDSEDDSPVVIAGKMTLSVISLDSETGTEDSSNSGRKAESAEEERRTSSSNDSEEFEKINAADLEDQINSIIEEAENIALTEENRFSLSEELDKFTEEILKAPQINEKDKDNDVLEEIKNQLNLEDDLLLALKEKEPEGKVSLPVTDLIKEFLNNEENALIAESKEIQINDLGKEDLGILEREKRSLSEERDGEEYELNVNLQGDEILNIINKAVDSTAGTEEVDLPEQQQGIADEGSGNLHGNLGEEHIDNTNDDNRVLSQEIKEEAGSLDNEESTVLEGSDAEKIPQHLVTGDQLISDLSQKEEAVSLEKGELKISKEELDSEKKQQDLPPEKHMTNELSQETDEGAANLDKKKVKFAIEESSSQEIQQVSANQTAKEEIVNLEKEEVKLSTGEVEQTLVPENDVIGDWSKTVREVVSLEKEEVKQTEEKLGFEKIEQNLVPENDVKGGLSQTVKEEAVSLEKEEGNLCKESDSEKIQRTLVPENDLPQIAREEASVEKEELDSEKMQQDVGVEDEGINEEIACPIQKIGYLESSIRDSKDSVSVEHKKYKGKAENGSRERTPEESNSNNRDLLLQGLLVKDDHQDIAEVASSEESDDQKLLDAANPETIVEKDIIGVEQQEPQATEVKEDSVVHTEEEKRPVQSELSSDSRERLNEEIKDEENGEKNLVAENLNKEGSSSRLIDEEGLIDDEDYDDTEDEELIDDEVRHINMEIYEDRRESMERRINGVDVDSSRNGAANRRAAAENEISEEEDLDNEDDDDEEIEEIIEYVDNTDEEGEEIVEINGNEQILLDGNEEINLD